jgi:hypothetical protein
MTDHIILQEKVLQLGQVVQILYLTDYVVLEVEAFQVYVFLEGRY